MLMTNNSDGDVGCVCSGNDDAATMSAMMVVVMVQCLVVLVASLAWSRARSCALVHAWALARVVTSSVSLCPVVYTGFAQRAWSAACIHCVRKLRLTQQTPSSRRCCQRRACHCAYHVFDDVSILLVAAEEVGVTITISRRNSAHDFAHAPACATCA